MVTLLLLVAAAAAQPSPEALSLGRELARHGTLAALLPLQKQKEVSDLIADNKQLGPDDQAKLRATADTVFATMQDRVLDTTGRAYAERLSVADLRRLVAFYRTPAAARFEKVVPEAILQTVQELGSLDFKGDVRRAFCRDTGKLCGK